ncbi:kinase-like protein [Dendrothele bispora CBS 962.96]|uniref:non-specific serine/threonine protein kinase n=1 Tax=Dendrothele bispora (strain CBS 962.96) TaxID=1314807 RepID=A0A4S8LB58_DENBC|nr:kinase-like protein [Dendrothele bispora CBS 962.96]
MSSPQPKSAISKSSNSKSLHDYQLGDSWGKGAFSQVYCALNWATGETVAVKEITLANIPKSELGEIMSEIDLLKNLNHPNIVKYKGFVKTREFLYIILEFCENDSLHGTLKRFGKFPENLVAVYISQVLQGLVYLHDQGVIHRDIKGANILTNKDGTVKLADFGGASSMTTGAVSNDAVVGSPYWMTPEVIEQTGATTASDIWSVGCVVIELLEALFRIVQDDCPPIPEGASPIKDCNLRIGAKKLLRHPWMVSARKQMGFGGGGGGGGDGGENVGAVPQNNILLSPEMARTLKDPTGALPPSTSSSSSTTSSSLQQQQQNQLQQPQIPNQQSNQPDSSHRPLQCSKFKNGIKLHSASASEFADFGNGRYYDKYEEEAYDEDFEDVFLDGGRGRGSSGGVIGIRNGVVEELKLNTRLSNKSWLGDDNDEEDRFAEIDEGFSEEDLEANLQRDKYARLCNQVNSLIDELTPSAPDFQLSEACDQLLDIIEETPEMQTQLVSSHGMLAILEVLEGRCSREVTMKLLQIINVLVTGDIGFSESFYFTSKKHPSECRLEASHFIRLLCHTSVLTLQMFISCRGLKVLVDLLDDDYSEQADLVVQALNGIGSVFELQSPTTKNDFCRTFIREGLLDPLSSALLNVMGNPGEATKEMKMKILLVFSQVSMSDIHVRNALGTRKVVRRLLRACELLEPECLVRMLKAVKHLSMNVTLLDVLQNANAIEILIRILEEQSSGPYSTEMSNHIFQTCYNLCRLNKSRQEEAAQAGIIPCLKRVIGTKSPLKQFALPILTVERWTYDGLTIYLKLLEDPYFQVSALESIISWYTLLLKPELISHILNCFVTSKAVFGDLLNRRLCLTTQNGLTASGALVNVIIDQQIHAIGPVRMIFFVPDLYSQSSMQGHLLPPAEFRPISSFGITSVHSPQDDDTMISVSNIFCSWLPSTILKSIIDDWRWSYPSIRLNNKRKQPPPESTKEYQDPGHAIEARITSRPGAASRSRSSTYTPPLSPSDRRLTIQHQSLANTSHPVSNVGSPSSSSKLQRLCSSSLNNCTSTVRWRA